MYKIDYFSHSVNCLMWVCLKINQPAHLSLFHTKSMVLLIYIYFELIPNFVLYEYNERVMSSTVVR